MEQDIFSAITAGDTERVKALIAQQPDVAHQRTQAGVSALMQARYENKLEIVDLLHKAAGDLDVFEAAALGDSARLRTLLAGDHRLANAQSSDGFTPLHLACFFGQLEAAETLLRQGGQRQRYLQRPDRDNPQRCRVAQRGTGETGAAGGCGPEPAAAKWLHRAPRSSHAQQRGTGAGTSGRRSRSHHPQ